jgi:hypothetical protein
MDFEQIVKQELLRKQNEIWKEYDEYQPTELYHYTSGSGLKGIIQNRQLWCTDVRHVNDPREGDHGMAVIRSVLTRKSVYKKFVEVVSSSTSLFGMKMNWTGYIACFCSAGESFQMWRDYACEGTGYALVFDYKSLFAGCQEGKDYTLFRVLYDRSMQIRNVEQILDRAIHLERELDIRRFDRDRFWMAVEFALAVCAIRFKDSDWSREQEFRLWISGASNVTPFQAFGKPRLSIGLDPSSLVSVIMGRASTDPDRGQIRELLQQHGFLPTVEVQQ